MSSSSSLSVESLTFTPPPLPTGYTQHHLVVLEECHCSLPTFAFPHTYTGYHNTLPSEVSTRIRDATIVIATLVPVTPDDLKSAIHLQCLAVMATGMGWVDRSEFAARKIAVVNCPQSNIPAVSEHWLGLYLASRKRLVEMHRVVTETGEWVERGTMTGGPRWGNHTPPVSTGNEVLGVVGYGALGRRIEGLARAVGFGEVLVAERKNEKEVRPQRTSFDEVLRRCTTLAICCPKDDDTIDLIADPELKEMRKEMCLINMARGGIVNETALANALRQGWIDCAATDVLEVEPAGVGTSPLLPDTKKGEEPVPNLIVSPHVSWYSEQTVDLLQQLLREGIEGFVKGTIVKKNVCVLDGHVYK